MLAHREVRQPLHNLHPEGRNAGILSQLFRPVGNFQRFQSRGPAAAEILHAKRRQHRTGNQCAPESVLVQTSRAGQVTDGSARESISRPGGIFHLQKRYAGQGKEAFLTEQDYSVYALFNNYIFGEVEPIYSKLGSESALRIHLLAAIVTNFVKDLEDIYKFIDKTFYAYQSEISTLKNEIDKAIDFLLNNGFIEQINIKDYMPTLFGNRTSSLYIDPLSALQLKSALEKSCKKEASNLSFLHAVCSTPDAP